MLPYKNSSVPLANNITVFQFKYFDLFWGRARNRTFVSTLFNWFIYLYLYWLLITDLYIYFISTDLYIFYYRYCSKYDIENDEPSLDWFRESSFSFVLQFILICLSVYSLCKFWFKLSYFMRKTWTFLTKTRSCFLNNF